MSVLADSDLLSLLVPLALAILVTTLHLALTHSLRRVYLGYWTIGWSMLAVCLALQLALRIGWPTFIPVEHGLSSVAAYGFGVALLFGCRAYATGLEPSRWLVGLAVVGGLFAAASPFPLESRLQGWLPTGVAQDLSQVACESAFQMLLAAAAVGYLWAPRTAESRRGALGRRLLALSLLTLIFFELHQLVLIAIAWREGDVKLIGYVLASNRFELVIDMLAAFGCIILALDSVREELERMNGDLAAAGLKLEKLAHRDAMTEAMNRHAFYTLLEAKRPAEGAPAQGSLAVLDVDHLKPINDELGHAAGDAVIRLVAKAIRALIRADDLLFRWGGDEFLVVLPNVTAAEAECRFAKLNDFLAGSQLPGAGKPIDIKVSAGIADFRDMAELEQAIASADERMFSQKAARRPALLAGK